LLTGRFFDPPIARSSILNPQSSIPNPRSPNPP
jgi:hypothetical protein